jgi:hypothetical protein
MVPALDTPVRDHPVSCDTGCRKTARDKQAPMATQLISMPAPTTTHPYGILIGVPSPRHFSMRNRAGPASLNLSAPA